MWETVKKKWWIALAAVFVIPYFAYQNMNERLGEQTVILDDKIPDLQLTVNVNGAWVIYQDGKKLPAEGLGLVTVTLEDHKTNPDKLKRQGLDLKEADFPVVVFFNQSGFDATGDPVLVRRARDGELLFSVKTTVPRLTLLQAVRSGGFRAWTPGDKGKARTITDDEFYKDYMGVEPPQQLPPADQLDKMSDEELKKLGVTRRPNAEQSKTGIRGSVFKVGGNPAVAPLKVPVHAYKGKIKPFEKFDDKDDRRALSGMSEPDGYFSLALPPGVYTIVVEVDGKCRGNALSSTDWPTVEVKDQWLDYEFRVPAR